MKSLRWFSVKTLYKTQASGTPKRTDAAYFPDAVLVEERVVLLRAEDVEDAIQRGEAEAREYASDEHMNPYGQRVYTSYLEVIDCYVPSEGPGDRVEVFSSTEVVSSSRKNNEIIDARMGRRPEDNDAAVRRKFCHA